MPAIGQRPAPVERAQRRRHELAGRGEEDGGVERLGRRVVGLAGGRAAELEGQLPGAGAAGQHVHGGALGAARPGR